jgi:predicted TIM-barrel fold metal-dependent hydrolase
MIVDTHYHFISTVTEEVAERLAVYPIWAAEIMGKSVDRQAILREIAGTFADPMGDRLLRYMEDTGVDCTCICTADNMQLRTLEEAQKLNQQMGAIAARYPNRVLAFAGVDPRRPEAPEMLKACFEIHGLHGLKYHPDHGYDPSGPESYRLLEIVQSHNGVLLTHTGPLGPPARPKYADPVLLADLAVDFPELKVIAAHMGLVHWKPWASLASHQPNLHGDLAMWDPYAFGRYELFCRELRALIDYAGITKVLFGTDNPIFGIVVPTRDWIQLLRDLPSNAPAGSKFTEDEVNAILGGNAARLLGLGS